jgi:plasmid stabilization system protein ParE
LKPNTATTKNENRLADAAKEDVLEIGQYLIQNASKTVARQITKSIINEVASLNQWPNKGFFIKELQNLNLVNYRELLAGPYRIIIERSPTAFYVHLVSHTSRDLNSVLQRRLGSP